MPILSCSGKRPSNLGLADGHLAPCPATPNCVSSEANDDTHRVDAFALRLPPDEAWDAVEQAVSAMPRTTVITRDATYLHAECASAVFGFVDDLELHLRAADNLIAVRSASRLGKGDLGVNRKRVERLRRALRARGAIR
jgi:uncharacterized protein (DUF1499 family)